MHGRALVTSLLYLSCLEFANVKLNPPNRAFLLKIYVFCQVFYLIFPTWQPCAPWAAKKTQMNRKHIHVC